MREHLWETFGFPDFREGQERVLEALAASDVLAVMPTGSGKSMCYVLPALAQQLQQALTQAPAAQ